MLNTEALARDNVSIEHSDRYMSRALAALQAEITNDPAGRGYHGKNNKDVADLVNGSYQVTVDQVSTLTLKEAIQNELNNLLIGNVAYVINDGGDVICEDVFRDTLERVVDTARRLVGQTIQTTEDRHARVLEIFVGIPYVNNQITAEDVSSAIK